jgi:hypothetical protein
MNSQYMGFLQCVGIDMLRPALLMYALLRYQLFGHDLKMERPVILIATLMMAGYGGLFVSWVLMDAGTGAMGLGLLVTFLLLLYPSFLAARWVVGRVIPGSRELSRKEARDIYYISLQGATYKGELTDHSDKEALAALRTRLGVTEREHSLLLEQEGFRELVSAARPRMRYAMLVDETGRLAAHVGPPDEAKMDKEIVAGMLTAVRQFVSDTFKSQSGELDILRYGDRTLVMEKGGGFILAAAVEGEAGPAVRTTLGDMLTILLKRHGNVLFEWDGNITDAEGAKMELQRMVDSFNLSGRI